MLALPHQVASCLDQDSWLLAAERSSRHKNPLESSFMNTPNAYIVPSGLIRFVRCIVATGALLLGPSLFSGSLKLKSPIKNLESALKAAVAPPSQSTKRVVQATVQLEQAKAPNDKVKMDEISRQQQAAEEQLRKDHEESQKDLEKALISEIRAQYKEKKAYIGKPDAETARAVRRVLVANDYDADISYYPNYIIIEVDAKKVSTTPHRTELWLQLVVLFDRRENAIQFRFQAAEKRGRVPEIRNTDEPELQDLALGEVERLIKLSPAASV
jgi:hypothetical protein